MTTDEKLTQLVGELLHAHSREVWFRVLAPQPLSQREWKAMKDPSMGLTVDEYNTARFEAHGHASRQAGGDFAVARSAIHRLVRELEMEVESLRTALHHEHQVIRGLEQSRQALLEKLGDE
ncbi:hypothetical protein FE251_01890 [Georgenia wutianyii]|uniref:Uncharacterized protein n=1 Tax=Georgenia wutianyii TaxID=2585135 RepID=A0ABX5VLQ5_9MICO|nr:hypothetical protein [Georgenia wutianyii]QDB78263.1 hypothetical protein FE251_01890 [Georgenia wutianyii]